MNSFRKHGEGVGELAKKVVGKWKQLLKEEQVPQPEQTIKVIFLPFLSCFLHVTIYHTITLICLPVMTWWSSCSTPGVEVVQIENLFYHGI